MMSEKRSLKISKIILLINLNFNLTGPDFMVKFLFFKQFFANFPKKDDVKSKHHGFLETHTNSRTNCDHILVKNGDYVKYGFIPK